MIKAIENKHANATKVGLLGMEMALSQDLQDLSKYLLKEGCSLSFSSLRADMISGPLLELLKASNLKSAVIAPDGGSERLRKVINKGITAQDCLNAAQSLVEAGIYTLKLYFMIGLPTEKEDDLFELVSLVHDIQERINPIGRKKGRLPQINLSINCFVPKAWTPFQYHPFEDVRELKKKVKILRKEFARFHNLKLNIDQPDNAYFQAVLARADRRVGKALPEIYQNPKRWKRILAEHDLDPNFYVHRQRNKNELFPWDIIDHGLQKDFLWTEYELALAAKESLSCGAERLKGKCRKCGVCS